MSDARPPLLFYCQHSLGLGHLTRSLALARALSERFRVVLLSGGRIPARLVLPPRVEVVELPPVGLAPDGRLVSRDRRRTLARALELRHRTLVESYRRHRPRVVLIELFPFGRKKFSRELLALLELAGESPSRPLVVCSLRDILVGRSDQGEHDERASRLANRWFDAVLVHSDPRIARLEESFRPRTPLRVPVHYTGFVVAGGARKRPERRPNGPRGWRALVSAGGGVVGEPLLSAAVEAGVLLAGEGMRATLVAGPFLPRGAWESLRRRARGRSGLELRRSVRDLRAELERADVSVSQCGYNTALEVLISRVPALVVPFSTPGEDEQMRRARRLERLGAVRVLEPSRLTPASLAREVLRLPDFRPAPIELDLDGAAETARLIARLDRLTARSRGRRSRGEDHRVGTIDTTRHAHG